MSDLIRKYKTVDEVAKNVKHDSLTHTLIETLIPDKKERAKYTHEERIHESVRRYMERLENEGATIEMEVAVAEKDDTSEYMDVDTWMSSYTHIDANGDLIIEKDESDYEDDTEVDEELYYEEYDVAPVSVLFMLNECIVDLTDFDAEQAEELNQRLFELSNPNEYYTVVYIRGYKTVKTEMRVGYKLKEIEEIFSNIKERNKV